MFILLLVIFVVLFACGFVIEMALGCAVILIVFGVAKLVADPNGKIGKFLSHIEF